nr:protein MLP1 homolog [Ipomoea batatas]
MRECSMYDRDQDALMDFWNEANQRVKELRSTSSAFFIPLPVFGPATASRTAFPSLSRTSANTYIVSCIFFELLFQFFNFGV